MMCIFLQLSCKETHLPIPWVHPVITTVLSAIGPALIPASEDVSSAMVLFVSGL